MAAVIPLIRLTSDSVCCLICSCLSVAECTVWDIESKLGGIVGFMSGPSDCVMGKMCFSLPKLGLIPEDAPAESSYGVSLGLGTIISPWNGVNLLFFCRLLQRKMMMTARSVKNAMLPSTEPMMIPRLGEDEDNVETEVGDSEGEDDGR